MIEKHYDILVAGGGLAGLCCAIAAARKGVKTALVHDRPVLGGNSSSEIRVVPVGSSESHSWAMETGIIEEILLDDRASNDTHFADGAINSAYDLSLYNKALEEKNLDVYLNTSVRQVDTTLQECQGKTARISAVYAYQGGSGKEFKFTAVQFVDCTGDGTLGYLAGAQFRYGRDAREDFNETLAPVKGDKITMGSSINFYARRTDKPVKFMPPSWAKIYNTQEEIGLLRSIYLKPGEKPDRIAGFWWMELGEPYHQIEDNQEIRHELLSSIMGVWDYYKNRSSFKESLENYAIDWIGSVPGKRESRRLMGDVVLCEENMHRDVKWEDAVCMSGGFIDIHINRGILNKAEPPELSNNDENYKNYTNVAPYTIPIRALYSKNVGNLWMAGRNISASRVALGSFRIQLILANMGQAVGTCAGYGVKNGLSPRQVAESGSGHIQKLQRELLKDDLNILGLAYVDEEDLATGAEVVAPGEKSLMLEDYDPENFVSLEKSRGQVIPLTAERLDYIELYLKNTGDRDEKLEVAVSQLENIWDKSDGIQVCRAEVLVQKGFEGWCKVSLNASLTRNKPYRIALQGSKEVLWAKTKTQATGTLAQYFYDCAGGCEEKNAHYPSYQVDELIIPPFRKWNESKGNKFSLATRVYPESRPYSPQSIINGYTRPYDMPNLWVSEEDGLPCEVVLKLDGKKSFNKVTVYFDTDLNNTHSKRPGYWRAKECVRDWQLWVMENGNWKMVYEEKDNYQRCRVVKFDTIFSDMLMIKVLVTNGDKSARIYGVRVYKD